MKLLQDIGKSVFVPESRREMRRVPAAILAAVRPEILTAADDFLGEPAADSFLEFEQRVLLVGSSGAP